MVAIICSVRYLEKLFFGHANTRQGRCGEEWCFLCMASWENIIRLGPTAHGVTCDYHPNKVRMRADQKNARANRMAELVHGGPVSETLELARQERNANRRAILRPLAALAAEQRIKAMEKDREEQTKGKGIDSHVQKKRKVRLIPAWEET
jgi:hypothetical protein